MLNNLTSKIKDKFKRWVFRDIPIYDESAFWLELESQLMNLFFYLLFVVCLLSLLFAVLFLFLEIFDVIRHISK